MKNYLLFVVLTFFYIIDSAFGTLRVTLGDTAAAASSQYDATRAPKYAVNGAGLDANGCHTITANNAMWMTPSLSTASQLQQQWFRVDLGQVYSLSHFKLWNFNFNNNGTPLTIRGIRQCEVYLSSSETTPTTDWNDTTVWTRVYDTLTFGQATGTATYAGEPEVSLSGHQARWLLLRVLNTFTSDSTQRYVGLSELQVFAENRPILSCDPPADITTSQIHLSGTLAFPLGQTPSPTDVFACWGAADGGTNLLAWDHTTALGTQPAGPVSALIPVEPDHEYVCRLCATNETSAGWSEPKAFLTAPVVVELPDSVSEADEVLNVTFRRPAALTQTDIALSFALGGEAAAGIDYLPQPTVATLPAGSETVQVQIPLINDMRVEPTKTLTVGLTPASACLVTPDGTNSTVLTDNDTALNTALWSFHMRVGLPGYSGSSVLTNFPVALQLSEALPGFRYADFASPADGGDLRATDPATGSTMVHEIENWNTGGVSTVWVQLPLLTASTNAIDLHWGRRAATPPAYATDGTLWKNGFGGVWHLQQANATDSTENRLNGTAHGNTNATALLGGGQAFNGSSYISVPDHAAIGSAVRTNLTLSLWLKSNVALAPNTEAHRFLEKGDSYFLNQGQGTDPVGSALFLVKSANNSVYAGNGDVTLAANTWYHLCGTFDGATLRLFVNGTQAGSKPLAGLIDDDQLPLIIGADDNNKFHDGLLDEVRIESVTRGTDWIRACYDSQKPNTTFAVYEAVRKTPNGTLILFF